MQGQRLRQVAFGGGDVREVAEAAARSVMSLKDFGGSQPAGTFETSSGQIKPTLSLKK